ncbi:hypothetical protein Vretimale_7079 [Volvox reticuliferus]|nr:hypothetical protein Vretifemale_10965 [Volvox reticuliferus]GIM02169.1 hypothetical protein Vretimale_7079 [Volvox reticuliferus]
MAPEHLSVGRISRATDVYSFGIVLWEMLTQQSPYSGMQPGQVARGISDGSLELAWPSDLHPPMDEVVALGRRCSSRDPACRPGFQEVMLGLVRLEGLLRNNHHHQQQQQLQQQQQQQQQQLQQQQRQRQQPQRQRQPQRS